MENKMGLRYLLLYPKNGGSTDVSFDVLRIGATIETLNDRSYVVFHGHGSLIGRCRWD